VISAEAYAKNVFLNCPFDEDFEKIQKAIVFTITDCGFRVRCSLEEDDSGSVRMEKIIRLIEESSLGIHDISRTELDAKNGLPRFNMPFELGLFLGARELGTKRQKQKRCLILDVERYRFQKFLSDIGGQAPKMHANDPEKAIKVVRNWLSSKSDKRIPGAKKMVERFRQFLADLPEICQMNETEPGELTFNEWTDFITAWAEAEEPT